MLSAHREDSEDPAMLDANSVALRLATPKLQHASACVAAGRSLTIFEHEEEASNMAYRELGEWQIEAKLQVLQKHDRIEQSEA